MKNVAKVMMAMVMMFAVLISGCANKEDEWKKAAKDVDNQWTIINAIYEEGKKERKQAWEQSGENELQYVTAKRFYRLKEIMADVEASLQKAEKIAKESDNKQWKDEVADWRHTLNKLKGQELQGIKPFMTLKNIVPEEDWNWGKEVKRPDIKEQVMNYKFHEEKTNYARDFSVPKDENAPWKSNSNSNDSKQESKPAEVKTNDGKAGIITGTEVRMRQAASTDAKILGYFDKGETVTILESQNGWHKVRRSNGAEGFVSADFCKQQ